MLCLSRDYFIYLFIYLLLNIIPKLYFEPSAYLLRVNAFMYTHMKVKNL
jgi:hypothetical protein